MDFCPVYPRLNVEFVEAVMLNRGETVRVQGFGGKSGILVVWDETPRSVFLCTEEGYKSLLEGKEAPIVGFPPEDILEVLNHGSQEKTPA